MNGTRGTRQLRNWELKLPKGPVHLTALGEIIEQVNTNGEPIDDKTDLSRFRLEDGYPHQAVGTELNTLVSARTSFRRNVSYISRLAPDEHHDRIRASLLELLGQKSATCVRTILGEYGAENARFYLYNGMGSVPGKARMFRSNSPLSRLRRKELQQSVMKDVNTLAPKTTIFVVSTITLGVSAATRNFVLDQVIPAFRNAGALIAVDNSFRAGQYPKYASDDERKRAFRRLAARPLSREADIIFMNYDYGPDDLGVNQDRFTREMESKYPRAKVVLTARRTLGTGGTQKYQGRIWSHGTWVEGITFENPVVHRVGCGDAFFGAALHEILSDSTVRHTANVAAAAGSAMMTRPGDITDIPGSIIYTMVKNAGTAADTDR